MGQSFWDVGGAQACPAPGTLPIPTFAGSPKDLWGLGTVWGRGTGHTRVWSSLIQPTLETISSSHFCSKGLWYRSDSVVGGQLLSKWHLGWRGRRGSLFLHPKPSQPHCGGTEHRAWVRGWEPGSGDKMGLGPIFLISVG